MAIDFPNSPSNGDIHTVSGKRWQWDGEKWQAYGASLAPDVLYVDQGNARVGINDTTPSYSLDVTGTAHVTGAITASGGVAGALTGNADTATEATNITAVANNSTDETVYPAFVDGATGTQGIETDTGLTYNPSTGLLTAAGFSGPLTGNVTGNASGSSGSSTGNAATATALATARTIGGTSFDGTANIAVALAATATALATARTIGGTSFDGTGNIAVALSTEATNVTATANNSTDETVYPTFVDGATGTQGIETDTGLTYNPSTGLLFASGIQSGGYLTGTLNTAAQAGITSVGTLTSLGISSGTDISPDSAGAGQFKVAGNGYAGFIAKDATAMHFGHNSSSRGLYLMTDETTRLAITGAGSVGIGTTTPAAKLDVRGQIMAHGDATANAGVNVGAINIHGGVADTVLDWGEGLIFTSGAGGSGNWTHAGIVGVGQSGFRGDLVFGTDGDGTQNTSGITEKMRISYSGNVGMGTASPRAALTVKLGASPDGSPPSGTWAGEVYHASNSSAMNGLLVMNNWMAAASTIFEAGSINAGDGSYTSRFKVDGIGNVGIGTSSPANRLTVIATGNYSGSGTDNAAAHFKGAGDYGIAAAFDSDGSSDDIARIRYLNAGANKWQVNYGDSIGWYSATWTERMVLTNAGILSTSHNMVAKSGDTNPIVIGTGNTVNGGNIAIGNGTLAANSSGGNNVAVGINALNDLTTSGWNVAIGNYALDQITTSGAQYNTAVGHEALSGGATGGGNVAMGFRAGDNITSGNNVIIGMQAHDIGAGNGHVVAVGYNAARNLNGSASVNVFVGPYTGYNVTSGVHDVMMGYAAGYGATTGVGNVIIGSECARTFTTAGSLTIIGYYAGYYTTGVQNVFLGAYAGHWNTTGVNNTGIGHYAGNGHPTTGGNNTFIGYYSRPLANNSNNSVTLGDANIAALRCATTTVTSLSDERDKTDIVDLDMGLDFVRRLRPRRFVWDDRHGGKVGIEDVGFVAQELQQAQVDEDKTLPYLLLEENPDKLEASMGKLLPSLVLAIQELSDKVDALT